MMLPFRKFKEVMSMSNQPKIHALNDPGLGLESKYTILSMGHIEQLQLEFENLLLDERLSTNPIFRGYLSELNFNPPQEIPGACAIIILACFVSPQQVDFRYRGRVVSVFLPSGYYQPDFTQDQLQALVLKEIVRDPKYSIQPARSMHLKMMAARSELGKYGRNNICYVEELGSFISLQAFFTDCPLVEDNWCEAELMETCQTCRACLRQCPMGCISEENFIINVGHCITLYNEGEGEFPDWMPAQVHHALAGCMRCQWSCPANREAVKKTGQLEAVSEEETEKILEGKVDEELIKSLTRKLKGFPLATTPELFPFLKRNVKAFIQSG
jgi:epoxyqueuosine reductase